MSIPPWGYQSPPRLLLHLLAGLATVAIASVGAHASAVAFAADAPLWTTLSRPPRRATPLADLADRAMPAVVHVRGLLSGETRSADAPAEPDAEGDRVSIGTGFIVHRDGYIVTNDHVVRNVSQLRVRFFDGREVPACVLGSDGPTDIALLKVDMHEPLPVLPLGDSDRVRVGEPVVAIGNPFGFNGSVTAGIVSAKERVVDSLDSNQHADADSYSFFIQTDASINLGNSGGPLIDQSGQVVGVSAAFWAGRSMQPAQGIGFAIPINMAKALLPRLRDHGSAPRSSLGVDAQPLDSALASALALPTTRGALLASVDRGSPAELAGIEPGDVITGWGNVAIATREDLKIDAQLTVPGTRVKVTALRNGRRIEREVTMRAASAKTMTFSAHPSGCTSPRGEDESTSANDLAVVELSGEKAARLPSGRGVALADVAADSAAAEAGMRVGDAVLRIGRAPIRVGADVTAAMKSARGDFIPILLRRSGYDFWVALPRR